jgi:hypothetical protein
MHGRPVFVFKGDRTPPTGELECPEAMLSKGKSCEDCSVDCYRKGFTAEQVYDDHMIIRFRISGGVR